MSREPAGIRSSPAHGRQTWPRRHSDLFVAVMCAALVADVLIAGPAALPGDYGVAVARVAAGLVNGTFLRARLERAETGSAGD